MGEEETRTTFPNQSDRKQNQVVTWSLMFSHASDILLIFTLVSFSSFWCLYFSLISKLLINCYACFVIRQTITKLTASALNFNVLGAAIKAVVESVSALDGESFRCSVERKFSLLYRMARYASKLLDFKKKPSSSVYLQDLRRNFLIIGNPF